ncbi:MAG: type I methionyl aminopeptidase [Caulobacterales bacterium]|nr:type I methionyl aminopeptidase [Caulobacterales bacterium]
MSYIDTALRAEPRHVKVHGAEGFEGMRRAGQAAAACLDMLVPLVRPGVTTDELDAAARMFMLDHGGTPACIFYRGYPKTICTSINHVVCHGIPNHKPLREGDIVNIDVTVIIDGWHGDTSRMFPVGEIKRKPARLIDVTFQSMWAGIREVRPGATLGDAGAAIQEVAEAARCSVVQDFCGHGIGEVFHEAPNVVNVGKRGDGLVLREGMFFTVEPMINLGRPQVRLLGDRWTAVTRDRSLSAQFEHTVGVTADGAEVFTLSPAGLHRPPYAQ